MSDTDKMTGPVGLTLLPEAAKFNLRIATADLAAASRAFGAELPVSIGAGAIAGVRSALCLGPDEWVLYSSAEDGDALQTAFQAVYGEASHSLTDVSDREVTIAVSGLQAADHLSTSCPRDVEAIPVGSGARTIFDTVPIVLTRQTESEYRIEVWRSYFPHVWALLHTANREFSAGL